MKRHPGLSLSFLLLLLVPAAVAEEIPQGDTESTVPELVAFHDVILPIWHTAYPNKDIAALKNYSTAVAAGFAKVEQAKLPGILRDKQEAWDKGLAEFRIAAEAYTQAASSTSDQKLLDAAEALHAKYEMMVRIVRPMLKEMDEFHKTLYPVFHRYLPEKQYDQVRIAAADLLAKAEAIGRATLPKRLVAKTEAFQRAAVALLVECRRLEEASKGNDDAILEKAVLETHAAYQALEKAFD